MGFSPDLYTQIVRRGIPKTWWGEAPAESKHPRAEEARSKRIRHAEYPGESTALPIRRGSFAWWLSPRGAGWRTRRLRATSALLKWTQQELRPTW